MLQDQSAQLHVMNYAVFENDYSYGLYETIDLNCDFCCDPHIMCYILNISSYCACVFSIRYVLPNHMLLQIAESLPREMQGILACCNPIPPLVRQNLLALHRIILEARDQPLVKVNIPLLLIFLSVGIISSVID